MKDWVKKYFSADNSEVNTGAIIATVAAFNTILILNFNFFYYHRALDAVSGSLWGTLVGLGGWAYHSSLRSGPHIPPPPPVPPPRME